MTNSRRRDCHSAGPPSHFSRCFNRDGEGDVSKMTVSPTASDEAYRGWVRIQDVKQHELVRRVPAK